MKYRDGYVVKENVANPACGCAPSSPGYPQTWYDRIASETKAHYLCDDPVNRTDWQGHKMEMEMEMEMDSTVNLSVMASLEEVSSIAYGTNNYYYLRRVCFSPL